MPGTIRLLFDPNVRIQGTIGENTVSDFLVALKAIRESGDDLVLEISTPGGDADAARRIALEVRLFIRHSGKNAYCVGKTIVYSAGMTILAAFPKRFRYLTEDAVLLVHERRIAQSLTLEGPMKSSIQIVREQLALLETSEKLEKEGIEHS